MTEATGATVRPVRWAVYLVGGAVPVLAVGWIVVNWSTVDSGTDLLDGAARGWLLGAVMLAALTWVAGAVCQQGAVLERLPLGRLLAVQFAGSAANHIMPAGLGVATVNMRFLRRRGLSRVHALSAVGLNTCAGISVHFVALAVLFSAGLLAPRALAGRSGTVLVVAAIVLGAGLVTASVPKLRRRSTAALRTQVRAAVVQWSVVGRRPVRIAQLWSGSAAVPVLHALTLACITRALGGHISVGTVFGAYFLASAVSAAVPSPGGFGSLDAALILTLTAGGLSTTTAVAAVIGYRLITVWLPLLPSACAIGLLHRNSVI